MTEPSVVFSYFECNQVRKTENEERISYVAFACPIIKEMRHTMNKKNESTRR